MRRMILSLMITMLALTLVVPISGCQSIAENAVEKATGIKVDEDGQKVTITGEDGSTAELSSEEGEYPDGFPDDFPRYDGAKIDAALKAAENGKDSFTVSLTSEDAAGDVFDWYLKELTDADWTIESQMNGTSEEDAYASLTVVKGDMRGGVTIMRDASDSETSIMVGLNPNE